MVVNEENLITLTIALHNGSLPVSQSKTLLKCIVTYVLLTMLKKSSALMPILTGLQMKVFTD